VEEKNVNTVGKPQKEKEKEKQMEMKKTAKKKTANKTKPNSIGDLVDMKFIKYLTDSYIDEEITKNELVDKLVRFVGKPIITISEMEYTVNEFDDNDNVTLCSRERKTGSNWVDVTDLTELKVWEYNLLVEKLNIHYPYYPIETLEGRFV